MIIIIIKIRIIDGLICVGFEDRGKPRDSGGVVKGVGHLRRGEAVEAGGGSSSSDRVLVQPDNWYGFIM